MGETAIFKFFWASFLLARYQFHKLFKRHPNWNIGRLGLGVVNRVGEGCCWSIDIFQLRCRAQILSTYWGEGAYQVMWTAEEEEHIGDIRLLNNDGGNVSEGWSDIEIYVREVLEVYQHNSLMRHTRLLSFTLPLAAPAGNPQKKELFNLNLGKRQKSVREAPFCNVLVLCGHCPNSFRPKLC